MHAGLVRAVMVMFYRLAASQAVLLAGLHCAQHAFPARMPRPQSLDMLFFLQVVPALAHGCARLIKGYNKDS